MTGSSKRVFCTPRKTGSVRGVGASGSACFGSDEQISGIHELDVFGGFLQPIRVSSFGKILLLAKTCIAWLDVSFFFGGIVFRRIWRRPGCDGDKGIASVA